MLKATHFEDLVVEHEHDGAGQEEGEDGGDDDEGGAEELAALLELILLANVVVDEHDGDADHGRGQPDADDGRNYSASALVLHVSDGASHSNVSVVR